MISRTASASRSWDSRPKRFEFLGRLMAQTLLDSRILDIPFAAPFFKWLLGQHDALGLADLELLEPSIYHSLRQIGQLDASGLKDLDMVSVRAVWLSARLANCATLQYFTYPGNDTFELVRNGRNKQLSHDNYRHFVDVSAPCSSVCERSTTLVQLIVYWRLVEGVRADMEAVCRGFQSVINVEHLKIFEPHEMEGLFCGCAESAEDATWSRSILQQCIRPDHGYNHESPHIAWLIDMLVALNRDDVRAHCVRARAHLSRAHASARVAAAQVPPICDRLATTARRRLPRAASAAHRRA